MTNFFIGEIKMFGGNFAPRSWALCNGQILSIQQNSALFSLLGTQYGGNGTNNFALPDFRGRVPLNQGQGNGLTQRVVGEQGGTEGVTLLTTQIPAHNHSMIANRVGADIDTPTAVSMPGKARVGAAGTAQLYTSAGTVPITFVAMLPQALAATGGSQAHPNLMPTLAVTFIIALQGIFPSRS